ncbi:MAG: TVP38/TMEM64 family protein, partial [Spirochaetota bacterium]
MEKKKKAFINILSYIALPIFILAVGISVWIFRKELWAIFSTPEKLKAWVRGYGLAGPLVFIGLQFIQVVIFVIPGEIPQVAGGYLFGIWLGLLYSLTGITFGSLFNFFLARFLGQPFIQKTIGKEKIDKFDGIIGSKRIKTAFFLLFVIPGIPKDVLCYVAGLSSMSFQPFLLISLAGRLPGILGSVFMGNAASGEKWFIAASVLAAATLLFLLGLLFRDKIQDLIEKI